MMLWLADVHGQARWPMPTYYGVRIMTGFWVEPGSQPHLLYRATTSLKDEAGRALVTAYPVRRPDGQWAIMLINRGATGIAVQIRFQGASELTRHRLDVAQYSPAQYAWRSGKGGGRPIRDLPPRHFVLGGWDKPVLLPGLSLTVLRGPGPLSYPRPSNEFGPVASDLVNGDRSRPAE